MTRAPRARPALAASAAALLLAACAAEAPPSAPSASAPAAPAPASSAARSGPANPAADARGVVVYRDYAAIVARDGDTIEAMAARVGVSPSELAAYNGLPVSWRPRRGDELVLPPRPQGYASQPLAESASDAPQPLASRSPAAPQPLSQPLSAAAPPLAGSAAPAPTLEPVQAGWSASRIGEAIARGPETDAQPAVAGGSEVRYHDVAEGETIYSIARTYGLPPESLIAWNALSGPAYAVRPGQVLTIPSGGAPAPERTAALATPGAGSMAAPPPSAGAPLPADSIRATPLPSPQLQQYQSPAPQPSTAAAPASPPPAAEPAPTATAAVAPPAATTASDRLLRPVPGAVLRPYSRDAGPRRNDGVDFAAQPGEEVRAAADGTVALISDSLGEWGTIVLIRHDERLMTVYGRMGEVTVSRGDAVRAGQSLGAVAPADDGQAFLHFEVRRGAFSENPMDFF